MLKDGRTKMEKKTRPSKGFSFVFLIITAILACSFTAFASPEAREDGLLVSELNSAGDKGQYEYLTMILKTGYAHEPKEKPGLNTLTNELIYLLLRNTCALEVSYYPFAEYTVFSFVIWQEDFKTFCAELDAIIRLDTLLLYDLCNELIYQHYHTAKTAFDLCAEIQYELLYGPEHPYLNPYQADYTKLNINEVNAWFREIYKPNNIIISTTAPLPADFLKKPNGRDMQKQVVVPTVPPNYAAGHAARFSEVNAPLNTVFISFPWPRPEEEDFWAGRIIQKYLQHQLWLILRQELGFCYAIQVDYSYLSKPAAPNLTIAFQVLPENTEAALSAVFRLLEKLETEALSPEEIGSLIEQEEKLQKRNYEAPRYLSLMDALAARLEINWLTDYEEYLSRLHGLTPEQILSFAQSALPDWRLSIVGPENTVPDSLFNRMED